MTFHLSCCDADNWKGVFTYLIDNLGVKNVQCEELIALDAEYLEEQRYVITLARLYIGGLSNNLLHN